MRKIVADFVLPALKNLWYFITEFIVPTLRNILEPVLGLVRRAFEFLSDKVRENREGLDVFIAIALKLAGFVRDTVAPILGGILATAFNLVVRAVGLAIDNFAKVFEIIGKVARFLGFDFSLEVGKATKTVNNLNTGTVDAYKSFAEQSRTIKEDVLPATNLLTAGTDALTSSNNSLAASSKQVTAALKEQFTAKQSLDLIRSGFGSAVGTTSVGALAGGESVRSAAELVGQFGGFVPGFNQLPTDPFFGFGRGSDIGSFKQGSGVVNINVNGTVIDPEGAARAIEQLLADSNARGGALFSDVFGINP
jgi:methyl-accepting chemotaxis protein